MSDLHFPKWRRSKVLMESPRAIYQHSLSRKAPLRLTSQTTSTFIVTLREVFTSRKYMHSTITGDGINLVSGWEK